MADGQGQTDAAAAVDEASRASRRPSAARPTSSSTPAPTRRLDAMRHSHGARHGRGGPRPVPGREARHRARDRTTASTTTSSCRAPLTPDDLEAIEARMGESVAADHPFVRARGRRSTRAGRSWTSAASRSRSRSSTTSRRRRRQPASRCPPVSFYEHGPFSDLCKGPARRVHGEDRAVQAARRRRRVLARRREAADAPAHLRHGLGDAGGARPVPVAARGGEEARPPPARRRSSTCSASTTSRPGSAFWHPKGQRIWRTLEGAMRELQERRGYEEVSHADPRAREAVAAVGHWDAVRATTCSWSRPRARGSPSSR